MLWLFSRFYSYYINLDGAEDRRLLMEAWWGSLCDLRRHPGVRTLNNQQTRAGYLGQEHEAELRASAVFAADVLNYTYHDHQHFLLKAEVELGPTLAHLKAIQKAYTNGDTVALIMEDDVAPFLVPYWRTGVNDLIMLMDESEPSWHILQLTYAQGKDLPADHKAKDFVRLRGRDRDAAAYLISRAGMDHVVRKYFRADGTIRLPLDQAWITTGAVGFCGYQFWREATGAKEDPLSFPIRLVVYCRYGGPSIDPPVLRSVPTYPNLRPYEQVDDWIQSRATRKACHAELGRRGVPAKL